MNQYNVRIEYRKALKDDLHMLKLSFENYDMYIDGWRLKYSGEESKLYPPSRRQGSGWKTMVEFRKNENKFWDWLLFNAILIVEENIDTPYSGGIVEGEVVHVVRGTAPQDDDGRKEALELISKIKPSSRQK